MHGFMIESGSAIVTIIVTIIVGVIIESIVEVITTVIVIVSVIPHVPVYAEEEVEWLEVECEVMQLLD